MWPNCPISVRDWVSLVPPTAALAGLGYMSYLAFCPEGRPKPSSRCNTHHRLSEGKIVDSVDVEDIAEKAAFCRCWKTKNVRSYKYMSLWFCKHYVFFFSLSGRTATEPMVNITRRRAITLDHSWWSIRNKRKYGAQSIFPSIRMKKHLQPSWLFKRQHFTHYNT